MSFPAALAGVSALCGAARRVGVTAICDACGPLLAIPVGAIGGLVYCLDSAAVERAQVDDPLDAFALHGCAGIWGVLAVAVFSGASFGAQLIGIAAIFAWTFVLSLIVAFIIKAVIGLRVSEEEEEAGVDIAECGMEAYPEFTNE